MSKRQSQSKRSHIHSIANLLLRSLRPDEAAVYFIPEENLREISATLERLVQTQEFLPAVTTLIRFCKVLEARGASTAARALVGAAQTVVPELERITGANSEAQAAVARARFARLMGSARPSGLPMQGGVDRGRAAQSLLASRLSTGGSRR